MQSIPKQIHVLRVTQLINMGKDELFRTRCLEKLAHYIEIKSS